MEASYAQRPKVLAPHHAVAPEIPHRHALDPAPTSQSATGALWMTDGNFKSALYLTNLLRTDPLTVTPIVHLSNGVGYPLPPVTMEPSGTAAIDVNQALAQQGVAPYATLSGFVEIQYNWAWPAVCGSVWNVDTRHSMIFVYTLRTPTPTRFQSPEAAAQTEQSLEGLWWKQESNVTAFVAFSNTTQRPLSASVQVLDALNQQIGEHSVTVSPQGTKIIELDELLSTTATAGGLLITHDGKEGDMAVNASLKDAGVGYSAHLPLTPRVTAAAKVSEDSYAELGLMSGPADSMMSFPSGVVFTPYSVVRNVSDQPVLVTPTLWWMQGGTPHSSQLQQITLPSHQTQNLDVRAFLDAAGLKSFSGSVNLVLDAKGQHGALLMASGSVDQGNTYVFEVVPHGVGESASKGMQYWSTANGDDTMINLWNPADEAQDFVLTIFYAGGHYNYPMHLDPRAAFALNVSEIQHSGMPDGEGNVMPVGVQSGSAELSGSLGENEHILVAVDSSVYNVRKATCGNYYCTTCNGWVGASIADSPFAVTVGGSKQESFSYTLNTGTTYDATSSSNWSSSKTSVATVSGGLTNGITVGSATLTAIASTSDPQFSVPCGYNAPPPCQPIYASPQASAPGNTAPRIDSIAPNWGKVGTNVAVVISGSGFGTAGTVGFMGSGITVTYGTPRNDGTISATFSIAPNAPVGFQGVTVTNNTTGDGSSSPPSSPINFQVTPTTATPVNLHVYSEANLFNGDLSFQYTWSSSTGNQSDLSACTVGESVYYPNYPSTPYTWPLPMIGSTIDPTVRAGSATNQVLTDDNLPPDGYQTPYFKTNFTATQKWWWSCSNYNNGATQTFYPDQPILRRIFKDTDGFWKYQITKSVYINTVKLPNQ